MVERKGYELAEGIGQLEIPYEDMTLSVRTAFGVHVLSDEEDVEAAMHAVDQAMYANKIKNRSE